MRKLSEIIALYENTHKKIEPEKKTDNDNGLELVLFDNVLDRNKMLGTDEITALTMCCFEKQELWTSNREPENLENLHDIVCKELHKAEVRNNAKIYKIRTRFEDLAIENCDKEYYGEMNAILISTKMTEHPMLTITCRWGSGVFQNDYYIIGLIAYTGDLETIEKK